MTQILIYVGFWVGAILLAMLVDPAPRHQPVRGRGWRGWLINLWRG